MDQRGSKLAEFNAFKDSATELSGDLGELYQYKLPSAALNADMGKVLDLLKRGFCGLTVMRSKRRIVGVSKTLHFLLPNLVMPVDGKYTMSALYGYNKYSDSSEKEFETFEDIFIKFRDVATRLHLTDDDVDQTKWNTSIPKLIDNAIIGFYNFAIKHSVDEFEALLQELL